MRWVWGAGTLLALVLGACTAAAGQAPNPPLPLPTVAGFHVVSADLLDWVALEGQALRGVAELTLTAAEPMGEVRFYLAGSPVAASDAGEGLHVLALDTFRLADGPHRIEARAATADGGRTLVAAADFTVANAATSPTPSGPIVITSGGVYRGNWESHDPDVAAVTIRTSEPVVIESSVVRGPGHLISAPWGDTTHLTVRDVYGVGVAPVAAGKVPGRFVHVDGFRFLSVERSSLVGTSGIYAHRGASGATLRVVGNQAWNIDGRRSDGRGGFDGFARVQFVQVNGAERLVDGVIAWNEVVNEPGRSRVEDVVNLFRVHGTAASPVRVHDNFIVGAFPADPARDTFSGGGIMLGDGGGSYQIAERNQVVGTGNYGIAIAGGQHHRIDDNRVLSCGRLADGTPVPSKNVGVYVWNQYGSPFGGHVGSGNVVGWTRGHQVRNDWWVPDVSSWTANVRWPGGAVPCSAQAQERDRWTTKLSEARVLLGPSTLLTPTAGGGAL